MNEGERRRKKESVEASWPCVCARAGELAAGAAATEAERERWSERGAIIEDLNGWAGSR